MWIGWWFNLFSISYSVQKRWWNVTVSKAVLYHTVGNTILQVHCQITSTQAVASNAIIEIVKTCCLSAITLASLITTPENKYGSPVMLETCYWITEGPSPHLPPPFHTFILFYPIWCFQCHLLDPDQSQITICHDIGDQGDNVWLFSTVNKRFYSFVAKNEQLLYNIIRHCIFSVTTERYQKKAVGTEHD